MHRYTSYGWLRGFSVVPSWGARVEEAWWFYDGARMREEVALARQVHANCIRLWIEFPAWMARPEEVTRSFLDAVAAIDEAGMKTMPCLFARWHDNEWDYGGTYTENLYRSWKPMMEYVRALATPLARDERVLAWDLCDEPEAVNLDSDLSRREFEWMKEVANTLRASGAQQPITIGTTVGDNIETFAPLCDVLCGHPFVHDRASLEALVVSFKEMAARHGKPFMVNECIPGCLDDQRRGALARTYTEVLEAADLGWMGWALREGAAISTRRDRYDANGLDGEGFHPFFTREGTLRPGLEFMTDEPALRPPW